MPPDSRSVSFIFHRDTFDAKDIYRDGKIQDLGKPARKTFRRRLQDKFDREAKKGNESNSKDQSTSERSWPNLSLSQVSNDSRRVLRNGANKISKTFTSVRVTFGSLSQKFKTSTRRRQRLEEQQSPSSMCKQTPQSRSRNILGRTPTKLYSPFGIESPKNAWGTGKENGGENTPSSVASKDEETKRHRFFRFNRKVNGFCALR